MDRFEMTLQERNQINHFSNYSFMSVKLSKHKKKFYTLIFVVISVCLLMGLI